MEKKNYWSSKWIFILAAIGSAAGIGNLWRFPFQVYDNGGGAFLVAYFVILLFMGIGLLLSEIAFGQKTGKGAPESFASVKKYLRPVGRFAVFLSTLILTYYVVVIARGIDYLGISIASLFQHSLPWLGKSSEYFNNVILHNSGALTKIGGVSIPVLIGVVIVYVLLYLFTKNSTKSVGKVVVRTATLPVFTLLILAVEGLFLPGSGVGLKYLLHTDWSKVLNYKTWLAAGGQIFFSLSIAMGIMISYGSFKKRDSEIVKTSVIVVLGNTLVSLLSAIAVFGTLGFMATKQGIPVDQVVKGGPSLAFEIFPEALGQIPYVSKIMAIIFFLTIFLLAIDSAMSSLETFTLALRNKFQKLSEKKSVILAISILFLISIVYTLGNGIYILDLVDHFVTSFGLLFVGIFETLVFIYLGKKLIDFIIKRNDWPRIFNKFYFYFSRIFSLIMLLFLLISNISHGFSYGDYTFKQLFFIGLTPLLIALILSILLSLDFKKS